MKTFLIVGSLCSMSMVASTNAPINAASMPKAGWPASTAALSNAQWPLGAQPPTLDAWPKSATGAPLPCWKTSILRDHAAGWPGQCLGLATHQQSKADCALTCQQNPLCAVWQYNTGTGCYQGKGKDCYNRAAAAPIPVIGAQRLQHGDVTVLKKMGNVQVMHLYNYGVYGNGNSTVGSQRCRAYCYSDIKCQYWQYGTGGCWVESPDWMTFQVQFPLTTTGGASTTSQFAKTVVDGEFIQHFCPPPPPAAAPAAPAAPVAPVAPAAPAAPHVPSAPWWPWVLGALLLLAALAALAFCLMHGGSKKKGPKRTRAARIVAKPQPVQDVQPLVTPPLFMPQPSMMVQQPMVQIQQQPMMVQQQQPMMVQQQQQRLGSYQVVSGFR